MADAVATSLLQARLLIRTADVRPANFDLHGQVVANYGVGLDHIDLDGSHCLSHECAFIWCTALSAWCSILFIRYGQNQRHTWLFLWVGRGSVLTDPG